VKFAWQQCFAIDILARASTVPEKMTGQLKEHIVTLQSSKDVLTDAGRLKKTLQADSDREPEGSEFMLHLRRFFRRTSKLQLMACEI